MTQRVAIVTGANRGIGLEISRQLAKHGVYVVATARTAAKAAGACQRLKDEGFEAAYHPCDVTDTVSVQMLRDYVKRTYGAPDILVNNAGVLLDERGSGVVDLSPDTLAASLAVNLQGPATLCRVMVPLMMERNYGRIVNMSSSMGQLSDMARGAPAYRISKTALNALTRTLAAELEGTNILVNSMCPGWVRSDMGGPDGTRTLEEGADTAVWLALLPDGGPSGGFFRDREPIPW